MLNAIDTTSALEGAVTIDQWLVERDKVVGQVKRLVKLWFLNKLGTRAELSRHLDVHHSTVSGHVDNLVLSGELPAEYAPVKRKSPATPSRENREPVENSTPQPAEPEMAPINLSTYVQTEELIQPERTSELYNFLSTQLSELNDVIYSNHGNFSDDEYRSLCGTAYHLYINLRTKCDHLEKLERNRTESFAIDATQV